MGTGEFEVSGGTNPVSWSFSGIPGRFKLPPLGLVGPDLSMSDQALGHCAPFAMRRFLWKSDFSGLL